MKWATELPTVEGWYWHTSRIGPNAELVTIYQVYDFNEEGLQVYLNDETRIPVDDTRLNGKWAGPLDPPEAA